MARRTIKVDYLARVEGEGGLNVVIRNGEVKDAELRIFEPPRFFEAFLRGRNYSEAPDITARICGICPVAYQMSSVNAMESLFGVTVGGQLRELRRLLYCGEWIESHVLHMYMLHAPDFLGYEGAVEMAKDHADVVKQGLALKKVGNELMTFTGGREIHPINVRVGGFYKVPTKKDVKALAEPLKRAFDQAVATVRFMAQLDIPNRERDYEFVSLSHPDEYPLADGRIVSNKGVDIPVSEFGDVFEEIHVAHSNALQARIKARGNYLVGPLARYSLNFDKLSKTAKELAKEVGLGKTCNNPYMSIVVRAVETVFAVEEALRIVDRYEMPDRPFEPVAVKPGMGHGASEAPRGLCYHRYRVDAEGTIQEAQIVPPTSQNQPTVEDDLKLLLQDWINLPEPELRHRCEQTVRNYDPCISCATHFLDLRIDRG